MPPPSELPTWTTTLANRVKPLAGALASGFLYGQRPPPKWFNWLIGMICDWLAWFKGNTCDVIQTLVLADGTYNVPAGCTTLEIVCVGAGQVGGNGGVGVGGDGGRAGEIVETQLIGTFPASLTVVVGINGRSSWVQNAGVTIAFAAGGGIQDTPADMSASSLRADQPFGALGGVGGSNAQGGRGKQSGKGAGGAGAATGNRGSTGFGYGAGGGGGRQSSGSASGGGGGGGGFGSTTPAGTGGGTSTSGAPGADGCVLFIATIRNTGL